MTRADLVTDVRTLLEDTEYSEDTITMAANWFVFELFNNTRTRLMEASDTLSGILGATTLDLPDDLVTVINFYLTAPQVLALNDNEVPYSAFMRNYANFATAAPAQARQWTLYGPNQMRFAAPLKTAHTFQIDYLREPVPVEVDDDEFELPDRYGELLAKGTLARIMEINEDYEEAQQERNNLEPLVTTFIRNEARGGGRVGPQVISAGRGRGSFRADRDF
jgi:hypothetical protein